jgi:hypothetical protein
MNVPLLAITNTSKQLLNISVETISSVFARADSEISSDYSGSFSVVPDNTIYVEKSRLDESQIRRLGELQLIRTLVIYGSIENPQKIAKSTGFHYKPEKLAYIKNKNAKIRSIFTAKKLAKTASKPLAIITNISGQSLSLIINKISKNSSRIDSDIEPNKSGYITMQKEDILYIEANRLDEAQLKKLVRLSLIKTMIVYGKIEKEPKELVGNYITYNDIPILYLGNYLTWTKE